MRASVVIGIILIVLGIFGLMYESVFVTTKEEVADIGPFEIQKEETKAVPIPAILGGAAVIGGIIFIAVGAKKKF